MAKYSVEQLSVMDVGTALVGTLAGEKIVAVRIPKQGITGFTWMTAGKQGTGTCLPHFICDLDFTHRADPQPLQHKQTTTPDAPQAHGDAGE